MGVERLNKFLVNFLIFWVIKAVYVITDTL